MSGLGRPRRASARGGHCRSPEGKSPAQPSALGSSVLSLRVSLGTACVGSARTSLSRNPSGWLAQGPESGKILLGSSALRSHPVDERREAVPQCSLAEGCGLQGVSEGVTGKGPRSRLAAGQLCDLGGDDDGGGSSHTRWAGRVLSPFQTPAHHRSSCVEEACRYSACARRKRKPTSSEAHGARGHWVGWQSWDPHLPDSDPVLGRGPTASSYPRRPCFSPVR